MVRGHREPEASAMDRRPRRRLEKWRGPRGCGRTLPQSGRARLDRPGISIDVSDGAEPHTRGPGDSGEAALKRRRTETRGRGLVTPWLRRIEQRFPGAIAARRADAAGS